MPVRPELRNIAATLLTRIEREQAFSDVLLSELAQDGSLMPEEFPVLQRWVRGVLETRASLDELLDPKLAPKTPDFVRNLLRVAVYQLRFLERIPAHVVVHESVQVLKVGKYARLAGLVNAVLRNVLRDFEQQAADVRVATGAAEKPVQPGQGSPATAPAAYNHPEWMLRRWTEEFGAQQAQLICEANNREWPLYFRVNTLRSSLSALQQGLAEQGVESEPAQYAPQCLRILQLPRGTRLQQLKAYRQGLFYVQDQSSILVAELLAPKAGEFVIDLCSAPGGKTCALALQMNNQGRILALDISQPRLAKVQENCLRLGITNVECRVADARSLQRIAGVDAVLADVPCTGLGVLGRKADARWHKREEEIEKLAPLQHALLRRGADVLGRAGRLLYSTCSIEIAEDELIVEQFLQQHPEFYNATEQAGLSAELVAPLGTRREKYFRSWPQRHQMAGAFAALLKR